MTFVQQIGSHKHGCCVMQRCLEKGREAQKLALADVIIASLQNLIQDPFGNYLVQNVLKLNNSERNSALFKMIISNFFRLSKLKFSSNVIEKVSIQTGLTHFFFSAWKVIKDRTLCI